MTIIRIVETGERTVDNAVIEELFVGGDSIRKDTPIAIRNFVDLVVMPNPSKFTIREEYEGGRSATIPGEVWMQELRKTVAFDGAYTFSSR
jgi:hypothetical protein